MAGHIASSSSVDWCTPIAVLERVQKLCGGQIGLDPCSNSFAITRPIRARHAYLLPTNDGLTDSWKRVAGEDIESVFVNPPFGTYYMHVQTREIVLPKQMQEMVKALGPSIKDKYTKHTIGDWVQKCHNTGQVLPQVFQLGPANVDTGAWHSYNEASAAICYFKGRLRFEALVDGQIKTGPAPMPCQLSYWGAQAKDFKRLFQDMGSTHIL